MSGKLVRWLALLLLLLVAGSALAQGSPHYRLEWSTTSGTGPPAGSAHYRVQGALGATTGDAPPTSASFQVQDGFWAGFSGENPIYYRLIYLPLVTRGFH